MDWNKDKKSISDAKKRVSSISESNGKKEDKDSSYYVYVLLDNNIPFYVGKGNGERCFQHEEELNDKEKQKKALKDLMEEYKKDIDFNNAKEIENLNTKLQEELTAKLDKIKDAKSNNTFDIAIVKYGLTEHEAFMCESSVINILKFCQSDLTNAVNGHASPKEKEIKEKGLALVKARCMDDFLIDCCPKTNSLKDIEHFINDSKHNFNKKYDNVVFISIKKWFPKCKNETDIWDAVRGQWHGLSQKNGEKVKYIFAMYHSVIKGIFKVKDNNSEKSDYQQIACATKKVVPIPESSIYKDKTENEIKLINEVIDLLNANPEIRKMKSRERSTEILERFRKTNPNIIKYKVKVKVKEKGNLIEKEKELERPVSFFDRGLWGCSFEQLINDDELKAIKEEFLNHYITDLIIPQNSVKRLY